jgi:hypothetical protein
MALDTKTGRERASGNAERHRWPGMQPAVGHSRRPAPSRAAAFWLVAGVLCLLFCAAGAPSPLYGVYRAQLGFSATTLTAVFAIYALVLLATLLVFGSVSDYLGRRRVILAALVVTAGACAVFLAARSVGLLFAARALQGLAVGTATGALGAALIDLQPEGSGLAPLITTAAPLLGLGAGALGASALAQYGPAPTRLVWWLLLGASVAAAAFLAGTAVAGVGVGLALLGVNRTLIPLAAPGQRAGLIAAIFIISFLGLSIPALIAGVATAHFGLHRTALAYCVATAALVAVAAGSLMLGRRGPATGQDIS